MLVNWDYLYNAVGIKDFIYFISSSNVQDTLFPLKAVFMLFTAFFLCAVIWFYINSTYVDYKYLADIKEFISSKPYNLLDVNRRWDRIMEKTDSGLESAYKLAVIEADDLLSQMLEDKGYRGETFEQLLDSVSKKGILNYQEVLELHVVRNSIVYNPDFKLDIDKAKDVLSRFEKVLKNTSL